MHHLVVIEGPLAILNKDMSQNMKRRRRIDHNWAQSGGQLCVTPPVNALSKRSQIAGMSRISSMKLLIPIATRKDEESLGQG